MTKKKSTKQFASAKEIGELLEEQPETTNDDAREETQRSEEAIQVQETDTAQAQEIPQAQRQGRQIPAGQRLIRMKETGAEMVVGERSAAALVRIKRAEYVS